MVGVSGMMAYESQDATQNLPIGQPPTLKVVPTGAEDCL